MQAQILDPPLGTIVEVGNVGRGIIRFSGPTDFKPGKWIGIELDEPKGKNDGSVGGVKYFNCKNGMGYGVFVRPGQIKKVLGNERAPSTPAKLGRPNYGHQRTNSNSLRVSPASSSRSASPAKQTPAKVPSGRVTAPQRRSISLKQTDVPRVSSPLAQSPPTQSPPPPQAPPPDDDSSIQALNAKIRVLENKRAADALHIRGLESRLSEAESFVSLRPKLQAKLQQQQTELIDTKRFLNEAQQLSKLNEERALEREEQLELVMLDKEMAEEKREMAESELEDLKERLAIAEVELEVLGEEKEEHSPAAAPESLSYIQLEKQNERLKEALLRLRDMAQETDIEQKQRIAEMEKDLDGFDELRANYADTLAKLSTAETQIEHLKLQLDDALGAEDTLEAMTERYLLVTEKIEEMRITIEDLEALKELSDELEENHVETEKALQEDIESLRTQLAASQLKITTLSDVCADYEGTIGQFRELVERLQGELSTLRQSTATAESASASALSQTAAILSANIKLQSTASKNQARMVELEMKKLEAREFREELEIVELYSPEVYNEQGVGGIGEEVEAEATSGARGDRDALRAYMFFQRIGWKADLINSIVAQTHGLPEALDLAEGKGVSEQLVGICEMRERLSSLSTLCKRFAAVLRRAEPEVWLGVGRLWKEIRPLEKRLDIHVDLLKRDEFRERECVSDVVKIQAQFNHLAEIYFADYFSGSYSAYAYDIGERQLGSALLLDLDLDMFAASIGMMKTSVEALLKEDEFAAEADYGGFDIQTGLYDPLLKLLERVKVAKGTSKKMAKRLEELTGNTSGALKAELLVQMENCGNFVGELVNFGISLAQQTLPHLANVRSSKTPFKLTNILSFAKHQAGQISSTSAFKPGTLWYEAVGSIITQLLSESSKLLPLMMDPENAVKITGPHPHPWVSRVPEIKKLSMINVEAERRIASLSDEVSGLVRTLKTRDQVMQELNVKVELMERRGEQAKKQGEVITALEGELGKAKKQEKAYEEAIEQLQGELDMLEKDNGRLKGLVGSAGGVSVGGVQVKGVGQLSGAALGGEGESVSSGAAGAPVEGAGNLDHAQLLDQYNALRGTLRFLRMENAYLKGRDLIKEIQALPPIHEPGPPRTATPPLVPSGLSDTDEEEEEAEEVEEENVLASSAPIKDLFSHSSSISLATEAKILYRSVIKYSSSPKVVDLSEINKRRLQVSLKSGVGNEGPSEGRENGVGKGMWMPRKKMPAQQVLERKMKGEKLGMRVRGLVERVERANIIRVA